MPAKNNDKNKDSLRELEKKITPISVVNNSSLKPYVESFLYYPENIYQQPLGVLLGFFEIKEYSEDSAYVVNFLNSVLKKEYYINPKRSVTESLDCALHKVNLALSELAKHGNVNWLGKLDGAVCILEKNNLHFSVAGEAKTLLCRNGVFNDISEGLAADFADPHPLKTFTNVSSGRLENKDKLLITSEDIFHILTIPQLVKNVERLNEEKFIQFLRTALSNELEMANVIVIDLLTKKATARKPVITKTAAVTEIEPVNVFSQQTFAKSKTAENQTIAEALSQTVEEENEYTDKKTGHIYIQGPTEDTAPEPTWKQYLTIGTEYVADFSYTTKKYLRRQFVSFKKSLLSHKENIAFKLNAVREERRARKMALAEEQAQNAKEVAEAQKTEATQVQKIAVTEIKEPQNPETSTLPAEEIRKSKSLAQKIILSEIKNPIQEKSLQPCEIEDKETEIPQSIPIHHRLTEILDKDDFDIKKTKRKSLTSFFAAKIQLLPNLSKIRRLFSRFTLKQKFFILASLLFIVFMPILWNTFFSSTNKDTVSNTQIPQPTLKEILSQDKNIQLNAPVNNLASVSDTKTLLLSGEDIFAVSKQKVIALKNPTPVEFNIPLNAGEEVDSATLMQDLNLILLLTSQKRIISFSPISQQFKENNIQIPAQVESRFMATYLTYLYLINPGDNQIYRYPRAEGGFGEKTNWLKTNTSLTSVTDLTIDDSLYYVSQNKVTKLFKGALEPLNLEQSNTPVEFSKIFTTIDLDNLYVLDSKNARLVVYAKTGEIVKQYFNENLKNATSLVVSEKNASAYIGTASGIFKLGL